MAMNIATIFEIVSIEKHMQLPIFILLGPNGAGKTTIGHILEEEFHCIFLSLEEFFLSRYPTYEAYRDHREEAYQAFEIQVRLTLARSDGPVVFEEVGLSAIAQALIGQLQQTQRVVLVKVIASEQLCVQRVADRGTDTNFPKPAEMVRKVHARFLTEVANRYSFDIEIGNEHLSKAEICKQLQPLFANSSVTDEYTD
jgi:shikimate kinase